MDKEFVPGFDRAKPAEQYKRLLGALIDEEDEAVGEGRYEGVLNRIKTYETDHAEMVKQIDALVASIDEATPRLGQKAANYLGLKARLLDIRPKS
jgi:hypothetical protein